jgi:sensory transduction protein kinase
MIQKITYKIHNTELFLGIFMIFTSIILPNFLLYSNLAIYEYIEVSIDLWDKEQLLYAVFITIYQNILRLFPIFFSVFLIADSVEFFLNKKSNFLFKIIFSLIVIQILYFIVYKIYFDMSYYFGKAAILQMFYLSLYLHYQFQQINLLKRSFILFLVFTGIQWLDITRYFSILDYKTTGELLFDIKNIAFLMKAENMLDLIGILFFILFFTFAILLSIIFFNQVKRQKMYMEEKEITKTLSNLKLKEIENRYFKEIQYLVHDLKTPLFSIGTLIEILDMQEEDEQRKIYYKKIEKSLEKCNIMVSEILRDKNKNFISTEKVFNFILSYLSGHDCIKYINYQNYCKEIKIKVNKITFSRAITNLIINSYEAFHEKKGKINLVVKYYKKILLIKVEDNGKGMSNEELEKAFEIGYTTKNSSGVGLNFIKTVLDEHECKLMITNKRNGGLIAYIIMKGENIEE